MTKVVMNAVIATVMGEAAANTRHNSSTLPPRVCGKNFTSYVRAHANTVSCDFGCLPFVYVMCSHITKIVNTPSLERRSRVLKR